MGNFIMKKSRLDINDENDTVSTNRIEDDAEEIKIVKSTRNINSFLDDEGFAWTGNTDCPNSLCLVCGKALSTRR